jgi:Niemann-Pick C1 protein
MYFLLNLLNAKTVDVNGKEVGIGDLCYRPISGKGCYRPSNYCFI